MFKILLLTLGILSGSAYSATWGLDIASAKSNKNVKLPINAVYNISSYHDMKCDVSSELNVGNEATFRSIKCTYKGLSIADTAWCTDDKVFGDREVLFKFSSAKDRTDWFWVVLWCKK